jgi:hypothetical protein
MAQEIEITQALDPDDLWFKRNLEALLGGEVTLVKRGKKKRIDRAMLAKWILEYTKI